MAKQPEKWMQGAVKRPGALTAKAKAAGMSPMEYARKHYHDKDLTGDQARFAVNAQKARHSTKGSPPFTEAELRQGHRKLGRGLGGD